jgi:hypothetical protein
MKSFISLAVISLAVATLTPSVTKAQTSVPTNPETSPNSSPVAPSDGSVPINATPRSTTPSGAPMMPSGNTTMPATGTPSSTSAMGMCGVKPSSTGMSSSTGMTSSSMDSKSYSTSTDSSVVPLMKLNTNPATATSTTAPVSSSTTAPASNTSASENIPRLLDASSDQIEYNNLIGPAHYIKLAVGSSPLCYLSVTPLQDVYATDSIRVLDGSGKGVPAVVTKADDGSAKISFDQPVSAGTNLVLALQGVEYSSSRTPTEVQYYVAGGFANYDQEIPYGVAQVQRFLR